MIGVGKKKKSGTAAKQPPNLVAFIKQYDNLSTCRNRLEERANSWSDDDALPYEEEEDKMGSVNLRQSLEQVDDRLPFTTDSTMNKFAMLVWKMLDACDTGGVGGNATREGNVIAAAVYDILNIADVKTQFEAAAGLSCAIVYQNPMSWLDRGHFEVGQDFLSKLGNLWKRLLKMELSDLGVSLGLRAYAVQLTADLKAFVTSGKNGYTGQKYKFNFMVKDMPMPTIAATKPKTTPKATPKGKGKGKVAAAAAKPKATPKGAPKGKGKAAAASKPKAKSKATKRGASGGSSGSAAKRAK